MKLVKNDDIKLMNELYLKYKTYAAVARETGFSPGTVKKYIINDYTPEESMNIIRFNERLPEFDSSLFYGDDWGELCVLSEEEKNEIRELWKELNI